MTTTEFEKFMSFFEGNSSFHVCNLYPLDKPKKGKKVKGNTPPFFKQEKVTEETFKDHFAGKAGLGICPVTEEAKCHFAAIDVDSYADDYMWLISLLNQYGIPLIPFRSKSGGLHLYVFFQKPVKADVAIDMLEKFEKILALKKRYIDGQGNTKVEIFPKQKFIPAGKNGAAITIPYYGGEKALQYLLDYTGEKVELSDAISYIASHKTSVSSFEESLERLPFYDAPRCVQTLILNNALGENSGRNNFLFTCAVYLKKKHGNGELLERLNEFNAMLPVPLGDDEIMAMADKVSSEEYNYKCGENPCKAYCDPKICSKREFGVGREKGHFTGLDYGKLKKIDAATPYWIWDLRLMSSAEDGEAAIERPFTAVTFPDSYSIMNQRAFSEIIMNTLHFIPATVEQAAWTKLVNKYLSEVEVETVSVEMDTSEEAAVHTAFIRFLTTMSERDGRLPYIKIGKPVLKDDVFYFKPDGFKKFLTTQGIHFRQNTLLERLRKIGAKPATLEYGNGQAEECYSFDRSDDIKKRETYFDDVIAEDKKTINASAQEEEEVREEERVASQKVVNGEEEIDDTESLF